MLQYVSASFYKYLEIMMDFFNGIKLEKDSISPNP